MLKIGDFSRIAGVSVRLLHYYEELGLFHPTFIDSKTGYRYYKSEQIINLNKILALKDLGLTLQEIKRYVDEEISNDELKGMLKLKKSQVFQEIKDELLRLRRIESRLQQFETNTMPPIKDVVIKQVPANHYLSVRNRTLPTHEFGFALRNVMQALHERDIELPGMLTILEHSETFPENTYDLEIGFAIPIDKVLPTDALVLNNSLTLSARELPAVTQMATLLHVGRWGTGMRSYLALGHWIELHGFELVGATREIYHKIASDKGDDNVVEFQLPIQSNERIFL